MTGQISWNSRGFGGQYKGTDIDTIHLCPGAHCCASDISHMFTSIRLECKTARRQLCYALHQSRFQEGCMRRLCRYLLVAGFICHGCAWTSNFTPRTRNLKVNTDVSRIHPQSILWAEVPDFLLKHGDFSSHYAAGSPEETKSLRWKQSRDLTAVPGEADLRDVATFSHLQCGQRLAVFPQDSEQI